MTVTAPLRSVHSLRVSRCAEKLWMTIASIGGDNGWYCCGPLWALRGLADRLAGGPGLRKGRRHPTELAMGDPVDFWRVMKLDLGKRLLLKAEMRLPGTAWLEFKMETGAADIRLTMLSLFRPDGFRGYAYWWLVSPLHGPAFDAMLHGVAQKAGCTVLARR